MSMDDSNIMALEMLISQISMWEEMIDNDQVKESAAAMKQAVNRNESMMVILPHFNSLNDIDNAQSALKAKAKLLDSIASVIDAAREAKKLAGRIDADIALNTGENSF